MRRAGASWRITASAEVAWPRDDIVDGFLHIVILPQPTLAAMAGPTPIGMYGVTAYSVARRTSEIGVRMALGADRAKVVRMVLRGVSNRVLIGLLAGVPLAIGAGRLLSAELYGVSSWDPFALIVATSALAICAFCAAIVPARRAASISPTNALRTE